MAWSCRSMRAGNFLGPADAAWLRPKVRPPADRGAVFLVFSPDIIGTVPDPGRGPAKAAAGLRSRGPAASIIGMLSTGLRFAVHSLWRAVFGVTAPVGLAVDGAGADGRAKCAVSGSLHPDPIRPAAGCGPVSGRGRLVQRPGKAGKAVAEGKDHQMFVDDIARFDNAAHIFR